MSYIVYILRFSNNNLYIGQTNNLDFRIGQHLAGSSKSAKFAKDHGSFVLAYTEHFDSRVEAMQREKQLKKWTRAKKEALIAGDLKLLKEL
ncbi:hypothetical protein A2333_01345 [Candidatus Wolfebacteria bacterium RIFOXYB2_FULL_49_7]|uniref:GIY-YIG domain-containing protein n=1 Tax=Candidatus Wolfebacteria bacterium RIFOXYB1_FULL_54_12 TaxID=1802559 RepID=A0A1F8DYU1_9BACT|nr:MAG: hypothetical protein A2372_02480 [Candidatus Wolfebacteria bacterium RIFOXYB1_FULL_54_12]OGM95857.1 MAG: hypothetical protein A2333_01345 [Candidatus Wolfebacteria bacterium RIFOXYB2_FULL_49_7]